MVPFDAENRAKGGKYSAAQKADLRGYRVNLLVLLLCGI